MIPNGFISLHRSMLQWEWYTDQNTKVVFLHLLLTVNWYDDYWRGILIKRGQRATSISVLSKEIGISIQAVRTAIKHLISTNELTSETTTTYTVFTVLQYNKYQEVTNKLTDEQQTSNKPSTNDQQLINNSNKPNNLNNISLVDLNAFFDSIWLLYPKKEGKGSVSKTQKEVLYKIGYDEIKKCVERYLKEKTGTANQFLKMGSTFFNSGYVDYLDKNYIKEEEPPKEIPVYQEIPDTTPLFEAYQNPNGVSR